MTAFRSADEFFQAIRYLCDNLDREGHGVAAAELRDGFACLNGLTDGWALFLKSVENVKAAHYKDFSAEHQSVFKSIHKMVYAAVHRR